MKINVVMLPGDGIGPEVMREAELMLHELTEQYQLDLKLSSHLIGGAAMDATGEPLPESTLQACLGSDVVLLGAVGGPQWSDPGAEKRPEQGLLQLRKALGLYMNLRPVRIHPMLRHASPLKPALLEDVDVMVVRELTGGIYFGEKGRSEDLTRAFDNCVYTIEEVERILKD